MVSGGKERRGIYPACSMHRAAIRPVMAPLAPNEAVPKLFERTKMESEENEAKTPQEM